MALGVKRTKTYIAGDWTGDRDAIDMIYGWKDDPHRNFDFVDVHSLTQSRDSSLNCTIKRSLKQRMDVSKIFVLVVGKHTKNVRSGSCQYCPRYTSNFTWCAYNCSLDFRSYVEYECEKAIEANIKIVVLYNSSVIDKILCPDILKKVGTHVAMRKNNGAWNYYGVYLALIDN